MQAINRSKYINGTMIKCDNMLIAWKTKNQEAVALSNAEAEFDAASMGAK